MEHQAQEGDIPAIYLEDPAQEPCWEKVHLKGVDEMSDSDIKTYANDYYPSEGDRRKEPYIQWIDDTSVNLVYKSSEHARGAMLGFVASPIDSDEIQNNPLELRTAKPLITKPAFTLSVRIAVVGDKKKKDARHASRYYLFHPEADPTERTRREFAASRPGRGENGDYRRRRFDDREHRRRRHDDDSGKATNDFEASMYDDTPSTTQPKERGRDLFSRITKSRQRSASPIANGDAIQISDSGEDDGPMKRRNGYRSRDSPPPKRKNVGRELFGDYSDSTAGMRSDNPELFPRGQRPDPKAVAPSYESNQGVARQLKADLFAAQNNSPIRSHRRSKAVDTRLEEDLIERFGRKSISMDSTKSVMQTTVNSGKELFSNDVNDGFSIKGSASQGMSIKGRADVKELFPDRFSTGTGTGNGGKRNAGKELFDQPVRSRGPRQRAGDLFD